MATHIGNEGSVAIGANTVAEVESWSITFTSTNTEKAAIGDTYVSRIAGLKDCSGTITCFWDETDSNGQESLTEGATVVLNLYPEGATSGDLYYTGNAIVDEVTVDVGGPNEIIKRTFTFSNVDDTGVASATVV